MERGTEYGVLPPCALPLSQCQVLGKPPFQSGRLVLAALIIAFLGEILTAIIPTGYVLIMAKWLLGDYVLHPCHSRPLSVTPGQT